jgi:hypothetical protein
MIQNMDYFPSSLWLSSKYVKYYTAIWNIEQDGRYEEYATTGLDYVMFS